MKSLAVAFSTSQFQTISMRWMSGREGNCDVSDRDDDGRHLVGNRGIGMRGDWLYFLARDDWLIASNATTGGERRRKRVADEKQPYVHHHVAMGGRETTSSSAKSAVSHRGVTSIDDALALDNMKIVIHGEARESVHLFAGGRPLNLDFINPRGVSGSQHLTGIMGG